MTDNTKRNNNRLYRLYNKMIFYKCWRYAQLSGTDFDYMLSEAHAIFMRVVEKWDGEREFGTYLYRALDNGLRKACRDAQSYQALPLEYEKEDFRQPTDHLALKWWKATLSDEARLVVRLLCRGAFEYLGLEGNEAPRKIRGNVQRFLIKKQKLTHEHSWRVLAELKEAVKCL